MQKLTTPPVYRLLVIALVVAQLLPIRAIAHPGGAPLPANRTATQIAVSSQFNELEESQSPLQLILGEGDEQSGFIERPPAPQTQPLNADELQEVLDRLPAFESEPEDAVEFRLPAESPPAPRTGDTLTAPFPPEEQLASEAEIPSGALEVLRFAPVGEVNIAPFINVTFNQPMVPLGTLQALSAQDVPVEVTPQIEGEWKWLGTRTLSFEHKSDEIDRFPKATEYTVRIPAGTESTTGGVLAEDVTWTFRTPAPSVQQFHPPGTQPQPRNPLFVISFDQQIDAAAVLETIRAKAGGSEYNLDLVDAEELELEKDELPLQARQIVEDSPEGRWLAFRSTRQFPANTTVIIDIGPGTPSAEGPLATEAVQSFRFQTFAPLRIVEHTCGYGGRSCPPMSPFVIRFNNPLSEEQLESDIVESGLVRVDPEIPNLNVNLFGDTLILEGQTQGRTAYAVTVGQELTDVFGQNLGQEETVTFQVGSADPTLIGPTGGYITVDPSASPALSFYSINYSQVDLRVYQVEPGDWKTYTEYIRNYYSDNSINPPGNLVVDEAVEIQSEPDQVVETVVDLRDALANGQTGHLIVVIEPSGVDRRPNQYVPMIQTWVQVTQIGLDAIADQSQLIAWATSLRDGSPLANVTFTLAPSDRSQDADATGTAVFELTSAREDQLLIAELDDDVAFLPQSRYGYGGGWRQYPLVDQLIWYVIDDRQMYRPGEEVHVKGWIRRLGGGPGGNIELVTDLQTIQYRLMGPMGNDIAQGSADLTSGGGFDLVLELPANMNLGPANLQLTASGRTSNLNSREYWHSFQVQEFRRPEFEVTAGNETTGPYFVGDEAVVFVEASYFAGGALPNAETTWDVSASPTIYAPPNWPDYTFGKWVPWWIFESFENGTGSFANFNSVTDASGKHFLNIDFESNPGAEDAVTEPYAVVANATVIDVNRQAWSAGTTLMVHPASLYVGLRSPRYFVEAGEPLDIHAIVTDVDGQAIGGIEIEIVAARLEWKRQGGIWQEVEADPSTCLVTSTSFPQENDVTCSFETEFGGRYRITATVTDSQGRTNVTQLTRWVTGGTNPTVDRVQQEEVTLVPGQETYQPGDIAEILVQSPFAPAEGRMTISRDGIVSSETFQMDEGTTVLRIPIEDAHVPNLHVQVDLNGAAARTGADDLPDDELPSRPAFASGQIQLPIPPTSRTLDVVAEPDATELAPGATTEIEVTVLDALGEPVADAELAVIVVDEAILALTNYQLTDPISVFYRSRDSGIFSVYSRSSIVLTDPAALSEQLAFAEQDESAASRSMARSVDAFGAAAPVAAEALMDTAMEESMAGADGQQQGGAIQLRTNFDPLALFAPDVTTDDEGRALVSIDLPDNLTRYRVMVVAASGDNHFGSAEANLTARLPLMVRPSAPRFLRFGDEFELPVVVQNQTDESLVVDVVVQAINIELVDSPDDLPAAGQRVTVPANDRIEVRFPGETLSAGTARFQIAAVSETYADAATPQDVPVYTPATTEAFATYGVVDEGSTAQPILPPADVFTQFGGLEIETSSTALQALTDALIYLTTYPYECSEQVASRIMAIATLRDVLTAFDAEGLPGTDEMIAAVERDIETLRSLQNFDGGYPIWRRGRESVPYYSIFVAHTLHTAGEKGFDVPSDMQVRALDYLRDIEARYPTWYSQLTRNTLSAYALYVRQLMGDVDAAKARDLFQRAGIDNFSLEGLAWLLYLLGPDDASQQHADEIRRHFANRVVETAGAANFTTSYGEDEFVMLHSNRRTDAIILDALMSDQPESDLIPKVVAGLLAHRVRGHWRNTQENAFILLALDRYFNIYEAQTPDFVARAWLGEEYVGGHEYQGRSTERHAINVPMSFLTADQNESIDLILNKEGDGRLYYRLGLRYAPTDLDMPPVDRGFVVQRTYEAVDNEDDVVQDEDGVWHIKAGARVRVRLKMVADNRRYHVALVDPLPAGLEIINPALAVSDVPIDPNETSRPYWWWGTWYEHQNLRDDRAEAFATLLWDGVYDYSYVARATTPGNFIASPTKAEEMYSPEVFGRSASDRVVVE